jgi:NADH-quinone oxidoreductase subunit N
MNLSFETFLPLLPVGILGLTTVVVMLAIAFARHHWWNATLTVIGLNLALVSVVGWCLNKLNLWVLHR